MATGQVKLKIAQVITRMDCIGGAQMHVRDISADLQARGYSVEIVTGKGPCIHSEIERLTIHPIRHLVRQVNPLADMFAFFEVRSTLRKIKPDLVATHSSKAGIIGRLAAKSLGIPAVFTAHGWSFTDGIPNPKKTIYRIFERITGSYTNGVIAVSEHDRVLAIARNVVPAQKIITVRNGVKDLLVHHVRIGGTSPIITMVARFDYPKMQFELLKALSTLTHLEWTMRFVGDGPGREQAELFAKDLEIFERVHFEGWRQDVDTVLNKSDLFVLISRYEGLPLSILEAMRAGLPIIATDVGGVKEAVDHKNGCLVPVGDLDELVNALEKLIVGKELRLQLGLNSRKRYEEQFTFRKMMKETIAYYEAIAGKEDF